MKIQDHFLKAVSILIILFGYCFQGCELDNYNAPDATLSGRLIDSETNEAMPTQTPNGARIRIYEFYNNDWSPQPYDFWVKQDGSFENKSVFAGKYRITAEGAFAAFDPIETEISGTKNLDIKVTPYLRLSINAVPGAGGEVTLSTQVSRSANAPKIRTISFVCAKTPYADKNTFVKKTDIDVNAVSDDEIISKTYSATLTGLTPNTVYYVRVGAFANNSGSHYNYSKVVEVKLP
ncbi:MAG: DUF3823 domain-containing protein [Tannerellaceae bacterium]|jgi:hypothetical protein|nr:DUF3823 domain-containing protein [Tannerellaceae bacterium]